MALQVKKFGGSSVATPEKIRHIAQRILAAKQPEDRIVVVVSAMGDSTDDLMELARQCTHKAYGRELDMLLTTGEQVSIALLAMTFMELGQPAISLTGPQAGIQTSRAYGKGRILEIKPDRVFEALAAGNIVVVAGFQGMADNGDLITLGRGGSDTTAVALAGALQADVCEIFTDVDGVYTADPRVVEKPHKLNYITYGEMLEMARLGAGVMQPRAVEMGSRYHVPIHVRSTFVEDTGTVIQEEAVMEGDQKVVCGVAHDTNVTKVTVMGVENRPGAAHLIFSHMAKANIDVDMIVQSIRESDDSRTDIVFTICETDLPQAQEALRELCAEQGMGEILFAPDVAKVSVVGAGMLGTPGVAAEMFGALGEAGVNIQIISTSEISISCLIDENDVERAVKAIHDRFLGDRCDA
ncbi:MAG: aspartate kinase [Veillonellaceae bacterium]|nr:aspartate kinase [Veillonellaceae bacterium]